MTSPRKLRADLNTTDRWGHLPVRLVEAIQGFVDLWGIDPRWCGADAGAAGSGKLKATMSLRLTAGCGDMAIWATASYVAWKFANPSHRNGFIAWQLLGITDLLLAVSLGTTAGLLSPQGASMEAVMVLPLSLIPMFVVPLCVIFHVICVAQARTWKIAPEIKRQTVGSPQQAAVR